MLDFSPEQQDFITQEGHTVLLAPPGCGKTTILSEKIRQLAEKEMCFYGCIAVSFTNKASSHLHNKVSRNGIKIPNSFFGTMDSFCLSEIIQPFAGHCFDVADELEVYQYRSAVYHPELADLLFATRDLNTYDFNELMPQLLSRGIVLLEKTLDTALEVITSSKACMRFITSKYSHIIIDEYQDCSQAQHDLVNLLINLGLTVIVAGDDSQSIYAFAHKYPRFLLEFKDDNRFTPISLTENHRSHSSISAFANNFKSSIENYDGEAHVYAARFIGNEEGLYQQLSQIITNKIPRDHTIGIFLKSNLKCAHAGNFIQNSCTLVDTPLDMQRTSTADCLKKILIAALDEDYTTYEFAEKYFNSELESKGFKMARRHLANIKKQHNDIRSIQDLALLITGEELQASDLDALTKTVTDQTHLQTYKPIKQGIPYLMNYHKSKGLEFDTVFLLDLYNHVLPYYVDRPETADKNVFYVGVTRAMKYLFLLTSSTRHDKYGNCYDDAPPSLFFSTNTPYQKNLMKIFKFEQLEELTLSN